MIEYFLDEKEKYKDDVLNHLRKHNRSHTGEKPHYTFYVYATKDNELKGSMKTNSGWDWAFINNVFYDNIDVLKDMVFKLFELYQDKAVGLKLYTWDENVLNDFLRLGFTKSTTFHQSPKRGKCYSAYTNDFKIEQSNKYFTISSKDVVNEYNDEFKEKQSAYNQMYNIKEKNDYILFSATSNNEFAGGVYCELFEDSMYIDLLAVNETYRGQGIGKELMLLAEKEARKRGFVSIDLGTAQFQARGFYEKLGYKVIDTTIDQPKGFECYTLIKELK